MLVLQLADPLLLLSLLLAPFGPSVLEPDLKEEEEEEERMRLESGAQCVSRKLN